jgi:hypothetical protein
MVKAVLLRVALYSTPFLKESSRHGSLSYLAILLDCVYDNIRAQKFTPKLKMLLKNGSKRAINKKIRD